MAIKNQFFLKDGICYEWLFRKCVYQIKRKLGICAKKGKYLKFPIQVDKSKCDCVQGKS